MEIRVLCGSHKLWDVCSGSVKSADEILVGVAWSLHIAVDGGDVVTTVTLPVHVRNARLMVVFRAQVSHFLGYICF